MAHKHPTHSPKKSMIWDGCKPCIEGRMNNGGIKRRKYDITTRRYRRNLEPGGNRAALPETGGVVDSSPRAVNAVPQAMTWSKA